MIDRLAGLIRRTYLPAWALMVLLFPITSLPLLAKLVRTNTIAAPAALLALWLLIAWLIPYLVRGGMLPGQVLPFFGILAVQILASARSFFLEIPPFRGASPLAEMGDAFVTLIVGSAFYLLAATWPRDSIRLHKTLQWINLSGLILVLWSLVQAVYVVFFQGQYPDWLLLLQSWFSTRKLFPNRVSGLAFEPSWLAHQLNMVYLPYWLAATLRGFSVHGRRLWRFSAENLLLAGGGGVLLLSFSRVGWLAFLLILTVVLITWNLNLAQRVSRWASSKLPLPRRGERVFQVVISASLFLVFLAVYLVAGLGALRVASQVDRRLYGFFNDIQEARTFYTFSNRLAFAERAVYWGTGWEVFGDYPLLGVGLGNVGFFFPEKMPAFGWLLTEIAGLFNERGFIPNTKSIWTRFLADTGIIGFAFFISWLYVLWKSARYTYTSRDPLLKTMGMMGIFVLLALFIEGFSVDSFALPYMWFALGLIAAAGNLFLQSEGGLPIRPDT